jgi:hypothetical protein
LGIVKCVPERTALNSAKSFPNPLFARSHEQEIGFYLHKELAGARWTFGDLYGESKMKVRGRIRWGS